jgi:glycolate oxidase
MASDARRSERIGRALGQWVRGEVLWDEQVLNRYSTDLSIYQICPLVVVIPRDVEDVVAALHFAREEGIPLTPRGGGTSTAGSALGRGIILAFPRTGPLNRILEFDEVDGEARATVEPAVVHDDLQAFLRARGLYLPADPSSGAVCLLGGNVATKASGPHALRHGSIDRYLRHVEFVTAAGEVVDTARGETIPTRIRDGVLALRADVLADVEAVQRLEARKDMKLASGYNLFTFVRQGSAGELVAQLMVGSVGTLGVITRATLRAEPYVEGKATTLLYFRNLHEAGDAVQHIRSLGVAAIEIMNHRSIAIARERRPDLQVPDGEAHMLLVEYEGPGRADQIAAVERLLVQRAYDLALAPVTVEGEEEQALVWKVRKSLLPVVRNYRPDRKALSLVNDVGVDAVHLADLILDVEAIFARHNLVAAIYGHAGSGNLHLRPLFDPGDPDLPALLTRVADEVYEAVFRYDGTITAEHGMGRVRTPYLEREWGAAMMGFMRRVKETFDPDDLLNPDVMFSSRALTDDLRPTF